MADLKIFQPNEFNEVRKNGIDNIRKMSDQTSPHQTEEIIKFVEESFEVMHHALNTIGILMYYYQGCSKVESLMEKAHYAPPKGIGTVICSGLLNEFMDMDPEVKKEMDDINKKIAESKN